MTLSAAVTHDFSVKNRADVLISKVRDWPAPNAMTTKIQLPITPPLSR
jgi:hypothetical protein